MHNDRTPQTVNDYPGLFDHKVTNPAILETMDGLRLVYLLVGEAILRRCPMNHSRKLAMEDLEASLMRAIQSLAVADPTTKQLPDGWMPRGMGALAPEGAPDGA